MKVMPEGLHLWGGCWIAKWSYGIKGLNGENENGLILSAEYENGLKWSNGKSYKV